ncbi:hypothetical protein U0070_026496 [Myodes glareolus]|uniref:Uncharacterized protein n=1 Tax=Myodes glareolus TaxID=447135 RepID=A0AAW0JKA2_MYOGA
MAVREGLKEKRSEDKEVAKSKDLVISSQETLESVSLLSGHPGRPQAQPCQEGKLHCILGDVCIPQTWLFDGHPDCPDSSDELSSGVLSAVLVSATLLILLQLQGQDYLSPSGLLVTVKESLLLSERKTSLI